MPTVTKSFTEFPEERRVGLGWLSVQGECKLSFIVVSVLSDAAAEPN